MGDFYGVACAKNRPVKRPWLQAAGTVALTGLLFIVAYNICNHLTGLRSDVGVWAFSWERYWPVIPAMIVPYWSEDLLFVIAPFLCRTRAELAVHRKRIVFCIIVGCIGFLLMPLRFAFPRPHVAGVFAPMFAALYSFDLPHNLFPSLHIALRTLLASMFLRVAVGPWRWPTHVWFSLIGISTLVTWQHHIVDVLGGFWLGLFALHLYRFDETPPPRASNRAIAIGYALLALACSQIARISWPWTFIFVWPAFAFGVGAFGYGGFGAGIYRKREGRLTWLTKALLGPSLFLQWLSWIYYRGKSARWSEVTPQVWIGALPTPKIARDAIAAGVTAVLDLTVEFSEAEPFLKTRHLNLPVLDLTAPTRHQLGEAVRFIEAESARGIVFIHCKAGYSRSAGAVGAWMLGSGRWRAVDEVIAHLKSVREGIVIRPEIRMALRDFQASEPGASEAV